MSVSRNGNGSHRTHLLDAHSKQTHPIRSRPSNNKPVLITGGAGFIGTNVAHRLLENGRRVVLYDNLSRAGVVQNLHWLQSIHGSRLQFVQADVRNAERLAKCVASASLVFHFAAQVAVTTSLEKPREDFEINAQGTLSLLEAIRAQRNRPPLIHTSTNKVYGGLPDVALRKNDKRYAACNEPARTHGISEERALDFHSPYGCSKGTADQYVLDYARSYGLQSVVFRMSCVYGAHQFGTEDQGWVAHFLIQALAGKPITLYGDGMQVRDILFVEDLVDAFMLAANQINTLAGQAFNVGGGPTNAISLLELLDLVAELQDCEPTKQFADWRTGDQRYYVSDTRKFQRATGWQPRVGVREGVARLYQWLQEARTHTKNMRQRQLAV